MRRASFVLGALLVAPAWTGAPFLDLNFDAASAQAKAEGKLLLVDFTAAWCPPCKLMEKQTWPDEKVQSWVREHAVAIQVDIDKQPELAQTFGFQAIPTVIFLKDGTELDRYTGFRTADELVNWGEAVLAGRTMQAPAARSARDLLKSDDVEARYKAAHDALKAGDDDVALQHYVWLWPHTLQGRGHGGIPLSFVVGDVGKLAVRSEAARKAFQQILDDIESRIRKANVPDVGDWRQWTALCDAFHEEDHVVAWYESMRDPRGRLGVGEPGSEVHRAVIFGVFDALVQAHREVDAVRLYDDVRERSRQDALNFGEQIAVLEESIPDEAEAIKEQSLAYCRKEFRTHMAMLHAAALADGRDAQAEGVAADLLTALDDAESRTTLVTLVLDLGAPRSSQLATWLDEAEARGADVSDPRARLAAPGAAAR